MTTGCIPNIKNLSMHPISPCAAGKHALSIVEAKEKIIGKLDAVHSLDVGGHGVFHAVIDHGQKLSADTLVKASNAVMQEHLHEKVDAKVGSLPPPHSQYNAKAMMLLQALEEANQALATGSAVASSQGHLFMRVTRHMTHKAVSKHVKSVNTDNDLAVFKQTVTWQGKPNIPAIEGCKADRVTALAMYGNMLYIALQSKNIRVCQAPIFEEVDCFGAGTETVQSLIVFEDFLYTAHQDNKIRVWLRPKGCVGSRCKHKLVAILPKFGHRLQSMLWKRNYVQVRRHKKKLWIEHADRVSALALGGAGANRSINKADNSTQGRNTPTVLYSASWDKTVKVWSLDNFKCIESFYAHDDAVNAMIVIDGGVLVTASADRTVKLWTKLSHPAKKKRHGLICTLQGHKAAVNALAISADGKVLYSGGADGTLVAWKKVYAGKAQGTTSSTSIKGTSSAEMLKQIMNGKGKISRGGSLAKQSSLGSCTAMICKNVSGEVLVETSGSQEIVLSRENSLASYGLSSLKKVISYHNRLNALSAGSISFTMKKTLIGHSRSILSVSTVADDVVCSSSADKTIRVWLRSRKKPWEYACVAVLAGNGGPVKAIAAVMSRSITPHSTCSFPSKKIMAHARQYLTAAPADDPASHYPLHADEESIEQLGLIVYSGGLDSNVWTVQLPAC